MFHGTCLGQGRSLLLPSPSQCYSSFVCPRHDGLSQLPVCDNLTKNPCQPTNQPFEVGQKGEQEMNRDQKNPIPRNIGALSLILKLRNSSEQTLTYWCRLQVLLLNQKRCFFHSFTTLFSKRKVDLNWIVAKLVYILLFELSIVNFMVGMRGQGLKVIITLKLIIAPLRWDLTDLPNGLLFDQRKLPVQPNLISFRNHGTLFLILLLNLAIEDRPFHYNNLQVRMRLCNIPAF